MLILWLPAPQGGGLPDTIKFHIFKFCYSKNKIQSSIVKGNKDNQDRNNETFWFYTDQN